MERPRTSTERTVAAVCGNAIECSKTTLPPPLVGARKKSPTRTLKGRLGVSAFERTQRFSKSELQSLSHCFSLNALYFNRYTTWEPKQIAAYHQHPIANRVLPTLDFFQFPTGDSDLGLPELYLSAETTSLLLAKLHLQLMIATDITTF